MFRSLEMRYLGQNYELELPISFDKFDDATTTRLWDQFHAAHQSRFGFSIPGEIIEIVNFSATIVSITPKPDFQLSGGSRRIDAKPVGHRSVMFPKGGWIRRFSAATLCGRAIISPVRP